MGVSPQFLLTIGSIMLMGLFISAVAERTFIPRVTMLLIFGVVIGEAGLNIIPQFFTVHFDVIADMTLLMVGFLIGGKLSASSLKESGIMALGISLLAALLTTLCVSIVLILVGLSFEMSVLLGCIASATAPAAIYDVINEYNHENKFSQILMTVVALDDVWALIIFGIGISIVNSINGMSGEALFLWHPFKEVFGSVLVGVLLGFPAAYLTGRIKQGQPLLIEGIGIVFVCGGLCIWLGVSYLIATIVMGIIISNFAKHHETQFHEMEGLESLFMVIFFVLAGASLDLNLLNDLGWITTAYVFSRILGKYIGALIGCLIYRTDPVTKNWLGLALLPQAGVAIGMALIAANQFPQHGQLLLTVVISSTIFFEIVGPIFTHLSLKKSESN